ncbi:MAG TPA: hypothetical protein VI524_03840 [Anaerolineales bacterium]|nr:hypothetical protein [Anaerolineales bacterium]
MSESPKPRIDPSIIAALIGVAGTIVVTLITLNANRPAPAPTPIPTWTPFPTSTDIPTPVPTHTVPVGEPSSTPAPDTPTPEPSPTFAPPSLGEDWANGCISTLWQPFPDLDVTEDAQGCLQEPIHLLFAADGRLTFLIPGRQPDTQVYGIFAPLPAAGTASITAFLKNLQDGEIWMGVFAEPNIESQGMVIVIPPGDVKKRVLVQKTMPGQVELQRTQSFNQISATYDVVFEFGSGSVRTILLRDTVFDPLPVGTTQQWLFVGYQVKKGNNRIDAEFRGLSVQAQ